MFQHLREWPIRVHSSNGDRDAGTVAYRIAVQSLCDELRRLVIRPVAQRESDAANAEYTLVQAIGRIAGAEAIDTLQAMFPVSKVPEAILTELFSHGRQSGATCRIGARCCERRRS